MALLSSFEIAELLLTCAYNGVDNVAPHAIARQVITVGEIAWDNCQCGQLAVAEQRRYPSNNFPLEEVDHEAECGANWLVIVFTVSLARCFPISDSNGNPPTPEALRVATQQFMRDEGMLRAAIGCCLDAAYDANTITAWELGPQEIAGPQGQCVETALTVYVGIPNGCGCP